MNRRLKTILAVFVMVVTVGFINKKLFSLWLPMSFPASRATLYGDVPKSKRLLVGFGDQITHEACFGPSNRGNDLKDYLAAGMDPNFCLKMYDGWQYRNPLMLFCAAFLNKSYYREDHILPDYDVEVFNQLLRAGADIHKYPYVWAQIYLRNNENIMIADEPIDIYTPYYVKDCNRVLKMFLDAGADVNRKGSPVPFDEEVCEKISEKKFKNISILQILLRHFMRQSRKVFFGRVRLTCFYPMEQNWMSLV